MNIQKTIIRLAATTAALGLATAANAAGSISATAPVTATILSPVTLTKTQNMAFGSIIRPSNASTSTVTLNTADTVTLSGAGDAQIVASTKTSAHFDLVGPASTTYTTTQTLSMTPALPGVLAGTPTAATGTLGTIPVGGTQQLNFGGQFDVTQGTTAQAYTGTLSVTVNYN